MTTRGVTLTSRFRGALLGLAVGDAVGAPLEGRRPGTFPPVTDPAGLGGSAGVPGRWTDDTAMALCLGDSLLAARRRGSGGDGGAGGPVWDPADAAARFLSWYRHGSNSHSGRCYGIGRTTRAALERYEADPSVPLAGLPAPDQAGNGGLMRVAPVALAYAADAGDAELLRVAADSCRVTHGAAEAVDGTAAFAVLLKGALAGVPRDALLDPAYPPVVAAAPAWAPAVAAVVGGGSYRRAGGAIVGSAYVVRSLEAALWAVATADGYRGAVLAAVNLGDDTDTTAAIAGALAGALWGEAAIPAAWRDALAWRDRIGRMGEELLAAGQDRAAAAAKGAQGGGGGG